MINFHPLVSTMTQNKVKGPVGDGLIAAQTVYAERSPTAAAERTCLCGRAEGHCALVSSSAK